MSASASKLSCFYVYNGIFNPSIILDDSSYEIIIIPESVATAIDTSKILPNSILYLINDATAENIEKCEGIITKRLITQHSYLSKHPSATICDRAAALYKDVPAPTDLPIIVSFDGAIAAGKSTLISILTRELQDLKYDVVPVQEPVDEWRSSGMLAHFYSNKIANAFTFQMYVLESRYAAFRKLWDPSRKAIYLLERSIYTDRHVFVEMLRESGGITDEQLMVYEKYWDIFNIPMEMKYVYLDTPVETSMERVTTRGRKEELSMKADYQEKLKAANDRFFETLVGKGKKVLKIGDVASKDFREDPIRIDLAKRILSWIFT